MRKNSLLLIPLALLLSFNLNAQLTNPGFENWTINGQDTLPDHWTPGPIGAGRSPDNHTGNYALSIWNWYYYSKGWVVNGDGGNSTSFGNYIKAGTPIQSKPTAINGYYKLTELSKPEDSAIALVFLKKWDTQNQLADTIGYTRMLLPGAESWTSFTINIQDWAPGIQPDSIVVAFESSVSGFCDANGNGNCLYLTLDDLSIETVSGREPLPGFQREIPVFPNPNQGELNFASHFSREAEISICDLAGRTLLERKMPFSHKLRLPSTVQGWILVKIMEDENIEMEKIWVN